MGTPQGKLPKREISTSDYIDMLNRHIRQEFIEFRSCSRPQSRKKSKPFSFKICLLLLETQCLQIYSSDEEQKGSSPYFIKIYI